MNKFAVLQKNAFFASAARAAAKPLWWGVKQVMPIHLLSSGAQALGSEKGFGKGFTESFIDPKNILASTAGTAAMAGSRKAIGGLGKFFGKGTGTASALGRATSLVDPTRLAKTQEVLGSMRRAGEGGRGVGILKYIAKGEKGLGPSFARRSAALDDLIKRRSGMLRRMGTADRLTAKTKALEELTKSRGWGEKLRKGTFGFINPLNPYSATGIGLGAIGVSHPLMELDVAVADPKLYGSLLKGSTEPIKRRYL